jgi:hypothetical protein
VTAAESLADQWHRELAEARRRLAHYRATIRARWFIKARQADVCRLYLDTRRARRWFARPSARPERIAA